MKSLRPADAAVNAAADADAAVAVAFAAYVAAAPADAAAFVFAEISLRLAVDQLLLFSTDFQSIW